MTGAPLLEVDDLRVTFRTAGERGRPDGELRAVDGFSISIAPGETVGVVGESGCGKSSAGLGILQLVEAEGAVRLDGVDVLGGDRRAKRAMRRSMQVIFQDPFSSLNPRLRIGKILREPLDVHDIGERGERDRMVRDMLDRVGLMPEVADRYPHEFSGGQRQRVGIARALMVDPSFIVCDEPTSALDVSTQAQIITLLEDLQDERGIAYLFIAHDLAVVRHISDRIAVMYLGRIVELAPADELCARPRHPYTRALLDAAPLPDPVAEARRSTLAVSGEEPDASAIPSGCRFRSRCPFAIDRCAAEDPALRAIDGARSVACLRTEEIAEELEAGA
jgi:oligopeptide transport system ATP-binding protein